MQKMQIELSYQDQLDLEKICTDKGWSYSEFFCQLLDGYRKFGFPEYSERVLSRETISKEQAKKQLPEEPQEDFEVKNVSLNEVDDSEDTNDEEVAVSEEKPKRRGRPPKAN